MLPEHLHAVWTLPPGDYNYSARWQVIKKLFSKSLPPTEVITASRFLKGERGIWQRRFWEHTIRDEADYAAHVDDTHINSLKHGWVQRVIDWPYSSLHPAVVQGLYPIDWGQNVKFRLERDYKCWGTPSAFPTYALLLA